MQSGLVSSFNGVRMCVVEAGTEITDDQTGQKEVVTEDGGLLLGRTMYCTKSTYDAVKKHFDGERQRATKKPPEFPPEA